MSRNEQSYLIFKDLNWLNFLQKHCVEKLCWQVKSYEPLLKYILSSSDFDVAIFTFGNQDPVYINIYTHICPYIYATTASFFALKLT